MDPYFESWRRSVTFYKHYGSINLTPAELDSIFQNVLEPRYSEPHRHYHTLDHVMACLDLVEELHCGHLELAIWFHDVIYDPHLSDNEEKSAELFNEVLGRHLGGFLGEGNQMARWITRAILATKPGTIKPEPTSNKNILCTDLALNLLLDVDLAILGAPEAEFAIYESQIRQEYAFVPEKDFREGRAKILEGFLAQPSIYRNTTYLEPQARANLTRSIAKLRGDI